jgi:trimethylamine--corrinoid protein Co-methyltransferase
MDSSFKTQCVPNFSILSEDQIKEIHLATIQVLETTGIRVMDEEAVDLLKNAGCRVKNKQIVQIPGWLVEECIRSAPSLVSVYNRKGEYAMQLSGSKAYFGMGTDLHNTYDLESGELRKSRFQDVINAAKVADYFDEIDFIASMALPCDVATNLSYIEQFRGQVENSIKPIFFTAAGIEDLSLIIEMAAAVVGGEDQLAEKPFIIQYAEPTSPLSHSPGAIKKLFLCADKQIPICYVPGILTGGTGPVTVAGSLTTGNAEALSGIVLHQLRSKGAPIISGIGPCRMDMLTGACLYECTEYRLGISAAADLYHYYEIPLWGTAGMSDSHCLDQQAGIEAAISLLMSGLNGSNLIHDVGYLGQGLIGSPAAIVMCADIISYVKHFIRGFDIGAESIALNVIQEVGHGGDFLAHAHTHKFFQREQWQSMFRNRKDIGTWQSEGSKTYGEIVTQKAREIIAEHKPELLPKDILQKLAAIRKKAEKELLNKHFTA